MKQNTRFDSSEQTQRNTPGGLNKASQEAHSEALSPDKAPTAFGSGKEGSNRISQGWLQCFNCQGRLPMLQFNSTAQCSCNSIGRQTDLGQKPLEVADLDVHVVGVRLVEARVHLVVEPELHAWRHSTAPMQGTQGETVRACALRQAESENTEIGHLAALTPTHMNQPRAHAIKSPSRGRNRRAPPCDTASKHTTGAERTRDKKS